MQTADSNQETTIAPDELPAAITEYLAAHRARALDTAIAQINQKTDLNIGLESLERSKHRRVTSLTFSIKAQAVPNTILG